MHIEVEDISMVGPRQIIEGVSILEDASIYVELEAKCNAKVQS